VVPVFVAAYLSASLGRGFLWLKKERRTALIEKNIFGKRKKISFEATVFEAF
jgi:hypothetical protein